MTSIEPEDVLEWPLTPQEWKNNYEIYQKSIEGEFYGDKGFFEKGSETDRRIQA